MASWVCVVMALALGGFSKESFPGEQAGCNESKSIPVLCFGDWGFAQRHVGDILRTGTPVDDLILSHSGFSLMMFVNAE